MFKRALGFGICVTSLYAVNLKTAKMTNNDDELEYPKPGFKNGRYSIPWLVNGKPCQRPSFLSVMYGFYKEESRSEIPSEKKLDAIEEMEVLPVNFDVINNPNENEVQATWLGHACFLVQLDNMNVLFDPVFSDKIGPMSSFGMKRYRKCPCTVAELPEIDFVVISHDHYDHLDLQTVKDLDKKYGSKLRWCVPMGLKQWLLDTIKNKENIFEFSWWDEMIFKDNFKVACVPAQHWCKRSITDDNVRLWAGWVVCGKSQNVYHSGDTGYCNVFKSIGKRYGPFDLSLIAIGAYKPIDILSFQHVTPEEAVQLHLDIKSKHSIGMHWGTFELAREHYLDPPRVLKETLQIRDRPADEFITIKHGETVSYPMT